MISVYEVSGFKKDFDGCRVIALVQAASPNDARTVVANNFSLIDQGEAPTIIHGLNRDMFAWTVHVSGDPTNFPYSDWPCVLFRQVDLRDTPETQVSQSTPSLDPSAAWPPVSVTIGMAHP
jgi:hypothetical protein